MVKITDIARNVAIKLGINENILFDAIQKNNNIDLEIQNAELIEKINELLNFDEDINKFDNEYIKNENTKKNFNNFKQNIGKLQILILLKNIEKSQNCDDILNSFIGILNNKLSTVNDILFDNISNTQSGGGNIKSKKYNFFIKFMKYIRKNKS
jgi:hypothetical protein